MVKKSKTTVKSITAVAKLTARPYKAYAQKAAQAFAWSPLPEVLLMITLVLGRWWKNSDFSYPSEIFVPAIALAVMAIIIWAVYRFIFNSQLSVHLSALLLSYSLYNYQWLSNLGVTKKIIDLLPESWATELTASLLISFTMGLTAGGLGWLVAKMDKKFKSVKLLQLQKVLLFAVVFIFVVQAGKAALRLNDIRPQLAYQYSATLPTRQTAGTAAFKPDIYYLVFDRYGNQDTLKTIYGYDNSDLLDFLSRQGFLNRPLAYANYPFTMSSVSSTMAMNYFPEFGKMFNGDPSGDWQTAFPYRSILNNPPIAQILKANGYQYNQISSWSDFTRFGIKADSHPTNSFRLNTLVGRWYLSDLQRDIFNRSLLSPWLKRGLSINNTSIVKYDLARNPRQNFEAQMEAIKKTAARTTKTTPQFSFAHVLVPHDPYIFKADGSTPEYDQNRTDNGIDERSKYVNQVTYLNLRLKDLIKYIREKSPEAAVVIQADEGPYPKEFRFELKPGQYYNPINLARPQMKQKFGILASYYLPGYSVSAAEQINSSVNLFRSMLNNYMGYDLPLLPDCRFAAGDKFTVYEYQLVNEKLTGGPAPPGCRQYQ